MWGELDQEALARQDGGGLRSVEAVAEIVVMERRHCYHHNLPCGASALRRRLHELGIQPLPSVGWIDHVLTRYGLTHGRTGWYEGEELDWLPKSPQVSPEKRCRIERRLEGTRTGSAR